MHDLPSPPRRSRGIWRLSLLQPEPGDRTGANAETRIRVEFPFREDIKDAIKQIPGRLWDGAFWTVPARNVAELLEVVEGHPFDVPEDVRLLAERGGRNARMRRLRRAESTQSYTPLSLNKKIHALTRETFSGDFWIIGQVQGWKGDAGRGFFTLVERYEDERTPRAITPAHISEETFQRVDRLLGEMVPPFCWQNNLDVRLLARADFQIKQGKLQVEVKDADPYYTVQLLNERREEALRRLDEEGISEQNLSLPLADVPLRIALLTSLGSDAEADFLNILRQSGLGFQVDVYGVRVQGDRVEPTVLAALERVARRAEDYDAVVMTRGGGSGLDLSGFDLYSIGRAVCLLPIPVISGIGHQKNHSLVDDVARSLQTPTEAAHFLVDRVADFLDALTDVQRSIVQVAQRQVAAGRSALWSLARDTARESQRHLKVGRRELGAVSQDVQRRTAQRLLLERERVLGFGQSLPRQWRHRASQEGLILDNLQEALAPRRHLRHLLRQRTLLHDLRARLDRTSQLLLQGVQADLVGLSSDVQRAAALRLQQERDRVGGLADALPRRWRRRERRESRDLHHVEAALAPQRHLRQLQQQRDRLHALQERLGRASHAQLRSAQDRLAMMHLRREAADPARVLERGFAVVTRPSGAIVRDAHAVAPGEALIVRLGQGAMPVTRTPEEPPHD